jgi:hypothetical protein
LEHRKTGKLSFTNGAVIIQTSISLLTLLDSGFRRNDGKNDSLLVFVTPVKTGVQIKVFKRKGPSTSGV